MDPLNNTLSEDLQQSIRQAANDLKAAGAEAVYVFGSVVDGPLHPNSDIDLAVSGLPPNQFFHIMGQLMMLLPRSCDLIDLDIDTPFTHYLKNEGKLHRVA